MPKYLFNSTLDWRDLILFTPVIYAMTAMWWIPEGDKYVPALVLIILAYFLASRSWRIPAHETSARKKPFALAISATALICGTGYLIKDGNIAELRTLSALSVFSGLSIFMALTRRLWLAVTLVSGAGFIATCFYLFFIAGVTRVHLNYNPIPFATGLATILVISLVFAITSRSMKVKLLTWPATLLLFVALAMTGTRGVVLPVTLILCATVTYFLCKHAKSNKMLVAGAVTTIVVAIAIGGVILESRINATFAEMTRIESGNETGSIGLRLQFWKAATALSTIEPLTGLGEGHKSAFQKLARQGVVNQAAANYAPYHYHNQFLDILVKRGVPGLLAFLTFLITPALTAFIYFRHNKLVLGSICGITFVYAVASVTDVPFNHPATINLFVLSMISLLSLVPEQTEVSEHSAGNTPVAI